MRLLWKLALMNIFRNRRRTLATLFTVCFGYLGLILTGGYILYVEKSTQALTVYVNHGGHIVIYKKEGLTNFAAKPKKYEIDQHLRFRIEEVLARYSGQIEKMGFYLTGMGILSNGATSTPILMLGIDPQMDKFVKNHPYVRRFSPAFIPTNQRKDFSELAAINPETISITEDLGELISRLRPFDQLPESQKGVQLAAKSFLGDFNAINGYLGPEHSTGFPYLEDFSVIQTLSSLQSLLLTEGVSSIALYLKESAATAGLLERLKNDFEKMQIPVELYPFYGDDVGMVYAGTMGFILSIGGFFFILILGAVTLSVVNTITIGIIERTREIGTLRAIGYTPRQLASIFFKENLLISLFCVVVGVLLSQGISLIINNSGIQYRPAGLSRDIPFMILPELWMSTILAIPVIVLACLTAYWVAARKTKVPLIQLLTDTGS